MLSSKLLAHSELSLLYVSAVLWTFTNEQSACVRYMLGLASAIHFRFRSLLNPYHRSSLETVYTVLVTRKKPVKDSDSQVLHISIGPLIYCKIRKTKQLSSKGLEFTRTDCVLVVPG